MIRGLYYFFGLLVGVVVLIILQWPTSYARLVACDVGQGDAILIVKGQSQVLIDGGPSSDKILACLNRYVPFYDRTIELVVLTNTDFDHLNGLSAVVERYRVSKFVTSDGVHESDAMIKLVSRLNRSMISPVSVEQGDTIKIGGENIANQLSFEVLWPTDTQHEYLLAFDANTKPAIREKILGASVARGDLNERSVVMLLRENNKKILLTGDIGLKTEKMLLELGLLEDIDILKVGHHGSKYANSLDYLSVLQPEISIVSVGSRNSYGHPTPETLERLSKVGSTIYRTDMDGDVEIELR